MKTVRVKVFKILSVLLFLTMIPAGCVGIRRDVDLSSISGTDEATYASSVNPFVLQRLGVVFPEETVQDYMLVVAEKLRIVDQDRTVSFVNDPAPAAFVLPGGEIVLTRGLLYFLETEDELIVMLGHLLGHDLARHGMQLAAQQSADPGKLMSLSADAAAIASADFLTAPFTDAEEIVADRNAAKILAASGFDPLLIIDLLPQIYARLATLPDFESGVFLQQHPLSPERIKTAEVSVRRVLDSGTREQNQDSHFFDEFRSRLLMTRSGYQLYQQALQLEKQGKADQAIGLYLQAAALAPDEVLILTGLGLAYMRQEALVVARQHLSRAARLDSHYYHPQLGLGYIYLQQNDFARAEKRLRRSQSLLPTPLGGYFLARRYDAADELQTAIKLYRVVARHYKGSQMGALSKKRIEELESLHGLE